MSDLEKFKLQLHQFAEEQSKNLPHDKLEKVETELADTLIYLIRLADK